jgi:DNA-binding beta-propeller fold protein YncE
MTEGAVTMPLLVTSAGGINGDGYSALLAFDCDGRFLGTFCNDSRVADPRGLAVDCTERLLFLNSGTNRVLALDRDGKVVRDTGPLEGLDPGGGIFGPDGRYYVGLRSTRTVMAFPIALDATGEHVLPPRIVPFPRGFAFGRDGRLFLASGIGPNGAGDNSIVVFAPSKATVASRLVVDHEFSPLDLAIAPNGNIVVSSEHPFGAADAVTGVREYDPLDGHLVRIFSPKGSAEFRKPRGLRFGPDGNLYCVARDEVVAFDFVTGKCLGVAVRLPHLYGQALAFFPNKSDEQAQRPYSAGRDFVI